MKIDLQSEAVGPLTPEELRDHYQRSKYDRETSTSVKIIHIACSKKQLRVLIDQLRSCLNAYIDPEKDRLGHGLIWMSGPGIITNHPNQLIYGESVSALTEFANGLIVGAANLGTERVLQLLRGWREGEPLRYHTKTLLSGVTVNQPLHLDAGIYIEPLPRSSNELPASLPIGGPVPERGFLGGVVLSVDSKAKPALFRPAYGERPTLSAKTIRPSWALGDSSLNAFCESLSLACNHCVRSNWIWSDYGDLTAFSFGRMSIVALKHVGDQGDKQPLQQGDLKCAWDIHRKRFFDEKREQRLGTAITRWARSKQPESESGLLDSFIDLRIALEALYLGDQKGDESYRGEMRFRLSLYGAWHLGSHPTQRSKYRKTLRDAYDRASCAVHAGTVKDTPENRETLAAAQNLCRQGILKRLFEGPPKPDWSELIMGAAIEDCCGSAPGRDIPGQTDTRDGFEGP